MLKAHVFKSAHNMSCFIFQNLNSLSDSSQYTSLFCGCWGGSHLGRKFWSRSLFFSSSSRVPSTCDSCASLKFYKWVVELQISSLKSILSKAWWLLISALRGLRQEGFSESGCQPFLLVKVSPQTGFQNRPRVPSYSLPTRCDCRRHLCFLLNMLSNMFFRII